MADPSSPGARRRSRSHAARAAGRCARRVPLPYRGPVMRSPETFDAYYVETRTRLLHEAYALTGDAPAARAAVRDAFVVTWHHWRKVGHLDDRDAYVRPLAFRRARRRHTARIWHRDKSLAPEARTTLDALSKLTAAPARAARAQRPVHPLAHRHRPHGRPAALRRRARAADRHVAVRARTATSRRRTYAACCSDLAAPLEEIRWPRATVIRRAGAARRRTHTVIGAGVAAAALVVSGSLVATGADAEPTSLSEEKVSAGVTVHAPAPAAATGEQIIDEAALLSAAQMARFGAGLDWAETATTDNLAGNGLLAPCQRERFSDPDGVTALARTWEGSATRTVRTDGRQGRRQGQRTAQAHADAAWSRPPSSSWRCPATPTRPRRASRPRRSGTPAAPTRAPSCWTPARSSASARRPARSGCARGARSPATITVGAGPHRQPRGHHRRPQHRAARRATRRPSPGSPPPSTRSAGPTGPAPAPVARGPTAPPPLDIGTPAGVAVGRRPAARRRRARPVGRHRPRAGAHQLRRHPLRPHHLPGQGHHAAR